MEVKVEKKKREEMLISTVAWSLWGKEDKELRACLETIKFMNNQLDMMQMYLHVVLFALKLVEVPFQLYEDVFKNLPDKNLLLKLLIPENYLLEVRNEITNNYSIMTRFYFIDYQKLEREARICRQLKHPNIG